MKANTARCILCALKKRLEALPETLNTPPVVVISAPDDESSHNVGDSIAFTATSTDAESGDISAGIVWTSDVDGSLGTGGTVNISTLSIGTHTITATSTDSGGLVGADSITITIAQKVFLYDFSTYADRAALLAGGFDFIAQPGNRDTENATHISYATGGGIQLAVQAGDLWEGLNNSVNTIFRNLPSDWQSVEVEMDYDPLLGDVMQAGADIYQDDDNYVGGVRIYSGGTERFTTVSEISGTAAATNNAFSSTSFWILIERDVNTYPANILTSISSDGVSYTALQSYNRTLSSPRLALFSGGPSSYTTATYKKVTVTIF